MVQEGSPSPEEDGEELDGKGCTTLLQEPLTLGEAVNDVAIDGSLVGGQWIEPFQRYAVKTTDPAVDHLSLPEKVDVV